MSSVAKPFRAEKVTVNACLSAPLKGSGCANVLNECFDMVPIFSFHWFALLLGVEYPNLKVVNGVLAVTTNHDTRRGGGFLQIAIAVSASLSLCGIFKSALHLLFHLSEVNSLFVNPTFLLHRRLTAIFLNGCKFNRKESQD